MNKIHNLKVTLFVMLLYSFEAISNENSLSYEIDRFELKVSNAEKSYKPVSIKELVEEGENISESLKKVLADLPESTYFEIKKKMNGYIINREELIYVGLDYNYFKFLSEKVGSKEDKLYFHFMKNFKPNSILPAYIDQQTDYSGCINYKSHTLSKLYIEGTNIMNKMSGIYERNVLNALSDMSDIIENGNCACDDKNSLVLELELIVNASEGSVAGGFFNKRLDAVKNDVANVTYHCKSQ